MLYHGLAKGEGGGGGGGGGMEVPERSGFYDADRIHMLRLTFCLTGKVPATTRALLL